MILRDLIEQIKLFNKYNTSKLNELKYELNQNNVKISGVLKIHWNLKQPIKISLTDQPEAINSKQNSFKATSVKNLSEKKCWDDSSLLKNGATPANKAFLRSQSVKYKPNKWKRTQLDMQMTQTISENTEDEVNYTNT